VRIGALVGSFAKTLLVGGLLFGEVLVLLVVLAVSGPGAVELNAQPDRLDPRTQLDRDDAALCAGS
jgi:hypothetical protein